MKWKGWGRQHNSWEPMHHLENAKESVDRFLGDWHAKQRQDGTTYEKHQRIKQMIREGTVILKCVQQMLN